MSAKKIISYSLFGYNEAKKENCFVFNDYLRGVMINTRLARLLYPGWIVRLHVDPKTYDGLKTILDQMPIEIVICEPAPFTKAMLWRMLPCFDSTVEAVICRDLDAPLTYREAQAVVYWMNGTKSAHAITDSISHGIPMMGGMIGFKPKHFKDYTKFENWAEMVDNKGFDYTKKGSDQDLINKYVYPKFAVHGSDSITQHYVLGMPNTFLNDWHNTIDDIDIGLPEEYKESNYTCGHIGSAGYLTSAMIQFLYRHRDKFADLIAIEKQYPQIFYWADENI